MMKNTLKTVILSLLLVISAPLCAVTGDTEVTTKVTNKKTPYKKTHKTVTKTKAGANKPATATTKTETVKKTPAGMVKTEKKQTTTTQARSQKLYTATKNKNITAGSAEPVSRKNNGIAAGSAFAAPVIAAPLLAGAAAAGSLKAQANHKPFKDNSVVYALEQHPQVSTFTARLKEHHLLPKLSGSGEYTIFAPLNTAFESGKHFTDKKLEEHIIHGKVDTQALRSHKGAFKTLSNGTITIHEKDGSLYANNAKIVGHSTKTKNGQIHFVESIITQ